MKSWKTAIIGATAFAVGLSVTSAASALWHQEISYDYAVDLPSGDQTVVADGVTLPMIESANPFALGRLYAKPFNGSAGTQMQRLAQDRRVRIPITIDRRAYGNAGFEGVKGFGYGPKLRTPFGESATTDNLMIKLAEPTGWLSASPEQCLSENTKVNETTFDKASGVLTFDLSDEQNEAFKTYRNAASSNTLCVELLLPEKIGKTGTHVNHVRVTGDDAKSGTTATAAAGWSNKVVPTTIDYTQYVDEANSYIDSVGETNNNIQVYTKLAQRPDDPATFTPSERYKHYDSKG